MVLKASHVSKNYAAVRAVVDADLSVKEGEIRALLGGNGSGKSTLAKIIGGIVSFDSGSVEIDGKPIEYTTPREAKDNNVVVTSQELSLLENLTVEKNINICFMPTKKGFLDKKKSFADAKEILEMMNLSHLISEQVANLSPNQKYMIELAKALAQNPRILIIDEITSALYRQEVDIVHDILQVLKSKGVAVLFISHRMSEIYTMCDSVTVMRNGETIGTYSLEEKTGDELLELMTGEAATEYHKDLSEKHQTENILEADQVYIKSYNNYISLTAQSGEIVGITGLQGHGQTDIVKSLYGLNGLTTYKLNGEQVNIHNSTEAVNKGLAYVSGDRTNEGTFAERSIEENLLAVSRLTKETDPDNIADSDEVLVDLGVRYHNKKDLITSLSGGNQQKVVVGRWLTTNPIVLLADDPSKGIDVAAREDLHDKFLNLAKQGSAVIMISSDNEELLRLTSLTSNSKVIVMYEGKISKILEGDEISLENISAASMPIKKEV
ncbi:MAG: sugar ABC transporter ATP-binding protein [Saccharofermentanales bacterium]